ncbi:f-box domain-containing protein [Diplodia corticola]|uniref:F-box domain-containing protein n=1 Tax=Diplodia corticola TaxID=236234 RepID=A0A1J9QZ19_9PEZI|nr:f-box domain-containing protein [Diplodia corticola]OJD33234.1 f-box domain-containing protein [Diplodia corticola]
MTLNLDRLPFDILFNVAARLSYADVIHLTLTCRQLYQLRGESTLCRRVVQDHAPFTQEAKLAAEEKITYREALERIYSRQGSFATATPSSACVVDYGSAVIYRQNVLCYMSHGIVRVRSVLDTSEDFEVDTAPVAKWLSQTHFGTADIQPEISLLYYSDWVVSLHFDYSETELCANWRDDGHWLIYVELRKFDPMTGAGVSLIRPPEGASKLFVRNTANYLFYGTHTGVGTHGHHEWKVQGLSLSDDSPLPHMPALQLDELVGSDLGSTVAFEIHDGQFYAVSNQTSFVVEEVDWTSFYHCIRFPLHKPVREEVQVNTRVYRRQHAEGPINDSWTDLGLQVDEKTNKLQIVEARREWRNGGSKQERTFYTREITFPPKRSAPRRQTGEQGAVVASRGDGTLQSASPTPSASPSASPDATPTPEGAQGRQQQDEDVAPLLPADDLLVQTLGSGNNPHWAPAEERLPRAYHPERKHDEQRLAAGLPPSQAFILARTKHRAYNLSCSAFLDLVEDDRCCPTAAAAGDPPCLRLRIGARKRQPLLPVEACDGVVGAERKGKARAVAAAVDVDVGASTKLPPYEDRFLYPPVRLWPPSGEQQQQQQQQQQQPGTGTSDGDDSEGAGAGVRAYGCAKKLHDILNAPLTPPQPVLVSPASSTTATTTTTQMTALSLGGAGGYTAPPPATEIVAAADERSVVFLRRPKYGGGERSGPIVLVSFDRGIAAEELACDAGVRAVDEEAMAAATRKDSGVSMGNVLADAPWMKSSTAGRSGHENQMMWKRDECWEKGCACVGRMVCGAAG